MFIPWIIHGESVRSSVCLCIKLTNLLVKSKVQNIKYRIMGGKKTRRKRKLVYIPRRYLDLVTTKSRYLTSGIQLRVRDTINLLTWVNAEELRIWYWGYDTGWRNAGISQTGLRLSNNVNTAENDSICTKRRPF